jgi:hypothetical protein
MDGGTAMYVNNVVYNPGEYAVHHHEAALVMSLVGNVVRFPSDPANHWLGERRDLPLYSSRGPMPELYLLQNALSSPSRAAYEVASGGDAAAVVDNAPVWRGEVFAMPPETAAAVIPDRAGAFPRHRDAVDLRAANQVRNLTGGYVDSQQDVGGYPEVEENHRPLAAPPALRGDDDQDGVDNLVEWLEGFAVLVE